MARLPDGWVFIPVMKDSITFEIKKMELVACRHCKHKEKDGISEGFHYCNINGLQVTDDWFCADGEEEDAEM